MAASNSNVPTTTTATVLSPINKRIRALRKKQKRILQMEESLSQGKHLSNAQQEVLRSKHSVVTQTDLLEKLLHEISSDLGGQPSSNPQAPTFGSLQERSSKNDNERYLCMLDGFAIYLLDLKENKGQSNSNCHDIPPLPKISTLNLPEKGLPILAGMFKWGSDAYIVGGREFSPFDKDDPHSWFMSIFLSFSEKHGVKGTSYATYRLSLTEGNLSLSESNHVKPLEQPIAWPVVEKIGDEIHVIEFFPKDSFKWDTPLPRHEFLDLKDPSRGWVKVDHIYYEEYCGDAYGARMSSHLVVGDWIFAPGNRANFIFDSKTKKWEESNTGGCTDPSSIDHVMQILKFGRGRCVGGFLHGELSNSLYVVFAIIQDGVDSPVDAVAYLVTVTGQVLCYQLVPHFFDGCVRPALVIESKVISVDEEEKTMCAIIDGKPASDVDDTECLFAYTFAVEELPNARSWIRDLWKVRCDSSCAIPREFVKVVVKDRHVYKMDAHAESDGHRVTRMQACFL